MTSNNSTGNSASTGQDCRVEQILCSIERSLRMQKELKDRMFDCLDIINLDLIHAIEDLRDLMEQNKR